MRTRSSRKTSKKKVVSRMSQKSPSTGFLNGRVFMERKEYSCPNCQESKPTMRGKCPVCGYSGLK